MSEQARSLGGFSLNSGGDLQVGDVTIGEIVGRDKIVNNIQHIYKRALSAAEAATQARSLELKLLAEGIGAFAASLQARANEAAPGARPYRGLLEYRLSDAELFFGRDLGIGELLKRLGANPLTILHAESGTGKTSLLQAGIAPRLLSAAHLPVYLRPYDLNPALALKRAFVPDLRTTPGLADAPLRQFLRLTAAVLGQRTKLLIMIDQFEEFFTQVPSTEREAFIADLAGCLDDASLDVRWVLALRSEFFGSLASFRPRIRHPFANDYRLSRLSRPEAQTVIVNPALRRGLAFEEGLVETLLNDLGGDEVAPPQLQLVCSALYDELGPGERTVTRASYEREGGAAGILRGHLERVLSRDLLQANRPIARRLLEALITSETRRVVRSQADLASELATWGVTQDSFEHTLAQLIDSRLLKVYEGEQGLAVELAHDYLLDEIRLDPELQARKAVQELLEQEVRAFARFKTLLTSERLAIIEPYRNELRLSPAAEQLLESSQSAMRREQAEAEARQQRELRALRKLATYQGAERSGAKAKGAANGPPLILKLILALFAVIIATTLFPALFALPILDVIAGAAPCLIMLAIVGVFLGLIGRRNRFAPPEPAPGAVFSPVEDRLATLVHGTIRLWDLDGKQLKATYVSGAHTLAFSPDGGRLLLTCEKQRVMLWDLASNQIQPLSAERLPQGSALVQISGGYSPDGTAILTTTQVGRSHLWDASGQLRRVLAGSTYGAFSPDSRTIATITATGLEHVEAEKGFAARVSSASSVHLWTAEGDIIAVLNGHSDDVLALTFSPDSAYIATASADGSARIWDREGEPVTELLGHTGAVKAVGFSPDGARLVTAGADHTARIWERGGSLVALLEEHTQPVCCAAFSPDGAQLLTASEDGAAILWSAAGRFQSRLSSPYPLRAARYSRDGRRIVTVGDRESCVWDRTGHLIATLYTAPEPSGGSAG